MSDLTGIGRLRTDNQTNKSTISQKIEGIDLGEREDAVFEAIKKPIQGKQDKIEINSKKIVALAELKDKTIALKKATDLLRNDLNPNKNNNVFQQKNVIDAYTSDGTSYNQSVGVVVDKTAINGNVNIQVTQFAKTDVWNGTPGTLIPNSTSSLNATGTFSLPALLPTGSPVLFTVTPDMSLNAVRDAINANASQTGVNADVFMFATNDFRLRLKAQNAGLPIVPTDTNGLLSTWGLTAASSRYSGNPSAFNSTFTVEGVQLTRSTTVTADANNNPVVNSANVVTDAIQGVTLSLFRDNTPTIGLTIGNDFEALTKAIIGLQTTYNDLNDFVNKQRAMNEEKTGPSEDAVLYRNKLMDQIASMMKNDLAQTAQGVTSGSFMCLQNMGIGIGFDLALMNSGQSVSFNNGEMTLDPVVFTNALASNFSDVVSVFGDNATAGSLYQVNHLPVTLDPSIAGQPIAVNYSLLNGVYTATFTLNPGTANQVTYNADVDSGMLFGQAGTIMEGLWVQYVGSPLVDGSPAPAQSVTLTKGVVSNLYTDLNNLFEFVNGLDDKGQPTLEDQFTQAFNIVKEDSIKLKDQIKKIEEKAEKEKERIQRENMRISAVANQYESIKSQLESFRDVYRKK